MVTDDNENQPTRRTDVSPVSTIETNAAGDALSVQASGTLRGNTGLCSFYNGASCVRTMASASPSRNIECLSRNEDSYVSTVSGMLSDQLLIDDPPPRPPPPKVYTSYNTTRSVTSGAVQVALGIMCIVCQSLAIFFGKQSKTDLDKFSYLGAGVWSGIVFVISGVLCFIAGKYKTKMTITWTMSLSFLSFGVVGVALFIMTCIGLNYTTQTENVRCHNKDFQRVGADHSTKDCTVTNPILLCYVAMLVAVTMEMIVSLKIGILCYNIVIAKKEDRLQYYRTPEGLLLVINNGPDYSTSANARHSDVPSNAQQLSGESQYPREPGVIIQPPPYVLAEDGKPASPPEYQESPPSYIQSLMEDSFHYQQCSFREGQSRDNGGFVDDR